MSDHFFAGAYGGDKHRLPPATRMECRICWYMYDPALGDVEGQIPPHTAFADLPDHWTCPQCDAPQDGFLMMIDG